MGQGGTLGDTRPEPPGTIWAFHAQPFERKVAQSSEGDRIIARRNGRPESMIGKTHIGTFDPHVRTNGEPRLRYLAR